MPMTFMKIHGAGNDYIVVNEAQSTATDLPAMARRFCPQRAGVGAAGLAVFAHRGHTCFVIRYFGPDGTESPADDDALRCCARMINIQYGYQSSLLAAANRVHESRTLGNNVGIRFPASRDIVGPFAAHQCRIYGVWTVSDNIVAFTDNAESINHITEESVMKNCSPAALSSASINFAEILDAASLRVRTFDTSTGAEAISSGTGVLASAVVAHRIGLCRHDHIEVQTRSGCSLTVQADSDPADGAWLYGPAAFSFRGELPCP